MLRSSPAAIDLIVREEDSGKDYYTKHYTHFEWPAGASGPTVGIGYDCGYVKQDELRADWAGFVPDQVIDAMVTACGLRGSAAQAFVNRYGSNVTITWDQAMAQFTSREMPKWEARIEAALPNTDRLSGSCFGALTSLGFNRGTGGFQDPSPRYVEMRNIRAHMAVMDLHKIPVEFLSMRRLWPKGKDLWNRRTHEAALFMDGLVAPTMGLTA